MSARHPIVLVDTNVWLDNFLCGRPGSRDSREFLASAFERGVGLVYPVHVVKDVFYLIQLTLKRRAREDGELTEGDAAAIAKIAWSCVQNMRAVATAVGADESDVWQACRYLQLTGDLEDNMVLAAAERAKADFLVTNDMRLIAKATVPAFSPKDASAYLASRAPFA